jgi:cell division protein FtsQ
MPSLWTRKPRTRAETAADREAVRAHEALQALRAARTSAKASPSSEWRDLTRRRRKRRAVRFVAGTALVIGTAAALGGAAYGGIHGFAWLRANTDLLAIHEISVAGTARLTPRDVIAAAGIRPGDDILNVNTDSLEARIERSLPLIRTAGARRTWKRELVMTVEERQPRAVVVLDRMCEVDEEGVVLPPDSTGSLTDLAIIMGLEPVPAIPGTRIVTPGLKPALDFIGLLSEPRLGLENAVSEIWAGDPDSLVMILMEKAIPVRVGRGDIPLRRLMAFRAVIEDLAERKIDPEYLDLRFSGQIVVKPGPETEDVTSSAGARIRAAKPATDRRGRRSRHGLNT